MRFSFPTPSTNHVGRLQVAAAWLWLAALLCALGLAALVPAHAWAQDFLPPEQAFRLEARAVAPNQVEIAFRLAPGTYLYRERMQARLAGDLPLSLPEGERKHDPTFDKVMEVYHHDLTARASLPAGRLPPGTEGTLTVGYQGCADAGLCYPPQTRRFKVGTDAQGRLAAVVPLAAEGAIGGSSLFGGALGGGLFGGRSGGDGGDNSSGMGDGAGAGQSRPMAPSGGPGVPMAEGTAAADRPGRAGDDGGIAASLRSGQLARVVPAFLLAGVLLSLTPCVLPMVPILSSIIVGQGAGVGRRRGFALALSYSQGMGLVYTALGVAAGLLGQGLAAYLQHPWVVLGFAALMVLLSLSMFGLYELRLPVAVQSWLGAQSRGLPGGRFVSVFVMGAVSALIVSPCVSAPLAGALLYISQTRDVVLGGSALYAMAWGMSVPLLLVGLSAGQLLPRAGRWMTTVKIVFGVLMLGMAWWVARPALPVLAAAVRGESEVVGAHRSVLPFRRVASEAELDAALLQAAREGRPVMLDFYADWCVSCIEMERETFSDAAVRERLGRAVLLQADVTAYTADDRALLKRFNLFGPPGMVFFDQDGRRVDDVRVVGFQGPHAFLKSLSAAGL